MQKIFLTALIAGVIAGISTFAIQTVKLTPLILQAEVYEENAEQAEIHSHEHEEGAWSPETLVRIFGVMHEREIRSRLRGDESLHASISEIDPLCTIETGGISKEVKTLAEELQRAETYDTDAELNVLHLPVDCGDIFRSDEGDQYVVVAQACDLVVRSDGRRRPDTCLLYTSDAADE